MMSSSLARGLFRGARVIRPASFKPIANVLAPSAGRIPARTFSSFATRTAFRATPIAAPTTSRAVMGLTMGVGLASIAVLSKKQTAYADDRHPFERTLPEKVADTAHEAKFRTELAAEKAVKRAEGLDFVNLAGLTSLGGVLGFCCGYATRKIGQMVMFGVGGLFIIIQVLAYNEFIKVDWGRFARKATPHVDKQGRRNFIRGVATILTHDFPLKAGFAGGFVLGWKNG